MNFASRLEPQQYFLQLFDELMAFRDAVQGHVTAQLLGALFFVGSLLVAFVLLSYWTYSAVYLLGATSEQGDQLDLAPLRWDRRLWEFFVHLIFPVRWMLQ